MRTGNRWLIATAGVFFQIALGAVYAWSVFRVPLAKQFGWSISEITLTFTISIFVLGFAAFFGGLWLNRKGPRIVALTGGALYGLGVSLASFSHSLSWLYLSYGLIGGIGLGFAYIVPVAVLVKWFPDRRGLITGIAVGGFGAGALITAPVATRLIQSIGVLHTFAYLGIAFLVVTVVAGYFLPNPPGKLEPGRLETHSFASVATGCARIFPGRGAEDLAMVGALAAAVPEYFRRHFGDFAGVAAIPAIGGSERRLGRGNGRSGQHRQRIRASVLGVGIGSHHKKSHLFCDVPVASIALLDFSECSFRCSAGDRRIRRADVLRGRVWHDAGVYRRLLRHQERRADLWIDVDGVGICQRVRAAAYRVHATG